MPAAPTICPGPCNNAYRRAEEALAQVGTEHGISPAWGQPVQCYGCVDRTAEYLAELPELLAAIRAEALEGTPVKITGTIGRVGLNATWPGQASRLIVDGMVSEMAELAADILKLRGYLDPDREPGPGTTSNEDRRITALSTIMLAHWDWAMQHHPGADEPHVRGNANPGGQVTVWYRSAMHFTKRDEQYDEKRLAPCPRCRGPYLVQSRDSNLLYGEPYVECRDPSCQKLMTKREYEDYVKAIRTAIQAAA